MALARLAGFFIVEDLLMYFLAESGITVMGVLVSLASESSSLGGVVLCVALC